MEGRGKPTRYRVYHEEERNGSWKEMARKSAREYSDTWTVVRSGKRARSCRKTRALAMFAGRKREKKSRTLGSDTFLCFFVFYHLSGPFFISVRNCLEGRDYSICGFGLAVTAISWFLTFCPCLLFCFFSLIFCVFFQSMLIAYAYFSCSSCRHLCFQRLFYYQNLLFPSCDCLFRLEC